MTNTAFSEKKCRPCEGTEKPLSVEESEEYLKKTEGWGLADNGTLLFREYTMKNFVSAVGLINKIAGIAEEENHHPDLHLTGYKHLRVELTTHAIGGLSENDFIVAAKINQVPHAESG